MQKGLAPIYLLIGVLVLVVVFFFVPFPAAEYPQCVQGGDCPKVWYWGDSLYKQIFANYFERKNLKNFRLASPSPIPSAETALNCEQIRKQPRLELTFEQAYCDGYGCDDAKTKKECESRDIAKVENGHLVSGQDGQVDCKWVEQNKSCLPNK